MARSVAITGAGSGIGRATAQAFLAKGWRVALMGRRRDRLEETADGHPAACVLPCDVSDAGQLDAAFARIDAEFGRLDVLFNNAGIFTPAGLIDEIDAADFDRAVAVNLTGAFACARRAFAMMRRQAPRGGRIINNGSISAHVPRPGSVCYTATKHGLTGLTRSLALDGRAYDIACGQIDIGNARTEMVAGLGAAAVAGADGAGAEATMDLAEVARSVLHMAEMPLEANIPFMTVMATKMPYMGRG
ncbi:SDR family oxidoreductase [Rhodovulum sp. YNF3179]|uniref:SDR family oxidoreductase n=1 Tax=Rhodovulum sp. YNF3179 TaxID=3425127 RepID=UPI003D334F39